MVHRAGWEGQGKVNQRKIKQKRNIIITSSAVSATLFLSKKKLTLTQFFLSLTYMVHICKAWIGAVSPSSLKNPNCHALGSQEVHLCPPQSLLVVASLNHRYQFVARCFL